MLLKAQFPVKLQEVAQMVAWISQQFHSYGVAKAMMCQKAAQVKHDIDTK